MFHFKEATCSEKVMLRRLQRWLEEMTFTSPIEEMKLTLTDCCSEGGRQASFLDRPIKSWEKLTMAINHLQQRYGKGIVKKAVYKEKCLLPEDSLCFAKLDVQEK
jgi:hypothetical protein